MSIESVTTCDMHELFTEFAARFGGEALDCCVATADRLDTDTALMARVCRRHAAIAREYTELNAASSDEAARAAGRRAMLIVLLLESGSRFFAA